MNRTLILIQGDITVDQMHKIFDAISDAVCALPPEISHNVNIYTSFEQAPEDTVIN